MTAYSDGISLLGATSGNTISSNTVHTNADSGIYVTDATDENTFTSNTVYSNAYGFDIYNVLNVNITSNTIYNSTNSSIVLLDCNNSVIDNNTIYDSSYYGIWLINGTYSNISSNTVYSSTWTGIMLINSTTAGSDYNTILSNNVYTNTEKGIYLSCSDENTLTSNTVYNNTESGIYLYNASNNTMTSNTVYDNTQHGMAFMSDSQSNDLLSGILYNNGQTADHYSLYFLTMTTDIPDNNTINDTIIYDTDRYIYDAEDADNTLYNLTLGYDANTDGRINRLGAITLNDTILNSTNLVIDDEFVSLDSTDTNAEALSVSANITLSVESCEVVNYYSRSTHTSSRSLIISDGTTFFPSYSTCSDNVVTFTVDSYSAYTVIGDEHSTSSPSSNDECNSDNDCDDDEVCTSGDCENVDCDDGYVEDHECIEYECTSDSDCDSDEECSSHECIDLDCGACEYESYHACIAYDCCSDSDCDSDEECNSHECEIISCSGYIEDHECIEYECTSDSDCKFLCIKDKCIIPKVNVNDTSYNFGLNDIGGDITGKWAMFNLNSKSVKIYEDGTKKMDLDNDGKFDIEITMGKIGEDITLEVITLTKTVSDDLTSGDTNTNGTDTTNINDQKPKDDYTWLILVVIVVVIAIVGLIVLGGAGGLVWFKHKKKKGL